MTRKADAPYASRSDCGLCGGVGRMMRVTDKAMVLCGYCTPRSERGTNNAAPQAGGTVAPNDRAKGSTPHPSQESVPDTEPAVAAPTPRTDEIDALRMGLDGMNLYRSLARQLEHELAGAKATIERQSTAIEGWKTELATARSTNGALPK